MKKLLFLAGAIFASLSAYGQGTVVFANSSATAVTNILTGVRAVAGTTFMLQLYFAADGVTDEGQFRPIGAEFNGITRFLGPGVFNAGAATAPTLMPPGTFGMFQIRAWQVAFGTSYEEAARVVGALVGKSNIVRVDTGDPTTVPPGTASSLTGAGLQAFLLTPVIPEPSVFGLGLLGAGALLLLRRRK